jgi:hypothetical protein
MPFVNQSPNRLSISHLMLWMATTSVVLAMGQWDLSTADIPENLIVEVRLRTLIWSLGFAPLHGMAVAGVLIFLWRRFRSRAPFPTEPGHWILVIMGAVELAHLAAQVSYLLFVRGQESTVPIWVSRFSRISTSGFEVLLAVVGAYSLRTDAGGGLRNGLIWRLSILAIGLRGVMEIFHSVAINWQFMRPFLGGPAWWHMLRIGYSLPGLVAVVAAFLDWRHKQRRDFLHWCGVAIVVIGPIVEWARRFLHA